MTAKIINSIVGLKCSLPADIPENPQILFCKIQHFLFSCKGHSAHPVNPCIYVFLVSAHHRHPFPHKYLITLTDIFSSLLSAPITLNNMKLHPPYYIFSSCILLIPLDPADREREKNPICLINSIWNWDDDFNLFPEKAAFLPAASSYTVTCFL